MFNFKESSHDIVESSRYIQRDRSHMGTTEINLNFGRRYGSKKRLTTLKNILLMLEPNTFGCIVFERWVGQ